jgi:serine/threonine protein phosphatase PrpC
MSEDLPITFSQGTDVGKVREHNEDWVEIEEPTEAAARRMGRLFIVADGMGGYQAGEVASRLAAETVKREYYAGPLDDPTASLRNAVQSANEAVYRSARSDRAHAGMGTTIVVTALIGRKAYIASVGDSRAYVVHKNEISQITQDHSFVGEQIRAGLLTKEQARVHPQRNVITRALGSQATVQVDTFEGELSDGDILILCTDGLTGHIPEDRIRDAVIQLPPQQAVHQLIEMAKEDGGTDNISMILLRMGPPPPVQTVTAQAVPAVRSLAPATGSLAVKLMPRPASRQVSLIWVVVGIVVVLALLSGLAVAALMMSGVLRGGGRQVSPTPTPTPAPVVPLVLPTVTQLIVPVPPTAAVAPGAPTQTLIPTPQHTPTSMPAPTQPRLPTASPGTRNTPSPVPSQMTPTAACTGGRVWNGVECACPPDRPDFLGGQCVPKGEGGGGGNEPPSPPR